jgi:hypothetical protein
MCNGTNSKGVLSVKKQYGVTPEPVKKKYEPAVKSTDLRALFATSGRLRDESAGGQRGVFPFFTPPALFEHG